MAKILMGVWDCPACGTKGIPGDAYRCPNCSRTRAADTKFYLPEQIKEVTDAAGIAAAQAGADWLCDFCGNLNTATHDRCTQCGAGRGERQRETREYAQEAIPRSAAAVADDHLNPAAMPVAAPPKVQPKRRAWILPVVVAALLACIGLGLYLFLPREAIATVSGKGWERSLRVETYGPRQDQAWADAVPAGARDQRCQQAVRSYRQVLTGMTTEQQRQCQNVQVGTEEYECGVVDLGNGRFEQKMCTRPVYEEQCEWVSVQVPIYVQEPVYDNYCTYTIDRWEYARTETASGRDTEPYWPAVETTATQREQSGGRSESYTLYIVDAKEKTWEYKTDLATWQQFSRGQKCTLKFNALNQIIAVESK